MNGAMDLLRGTASGSEDKGDGGKPAQTNGAMELLKGTRTAPVSDESPQPPAKKDDGEDPVVKELAELRKVIGRQGQELGELRKQKTQTAAQPEAAEIPDAPVPSKFENDADYQKAMKAWVKDVNAINTRTVAAQNMADEFEKQRIAAGISDEDWDETLEILNDPRHQNPATMRALAQYLKDPSKITEEAALKLQKLTSRTGIPGTTGTAAGKTDAGSDFTIEEVKSFNAVMQTPIGRRSVAAKEHMDRFGRFVKPTR